MPFPSDLWQQNNAVGGHGGGDFQLVAETGAFVKRVRVYHGTSKWGSNGKKGCLLGIEMDCTDGKQFSFGGTSSSLAFTECHIDVANGEKIKEMSLWGQGDGKWDRTSLLWFTTNKDQKFSAGLKLLSENEYKMDVGSGLLLGFEGRSWSVIDSLKPVFLKRVAKQYIDKVKYPKLDLDDTSFLQMQYLDRAKSMWNGTSSKVKIAGQITEKEETMFSNKLSVSLGVALEFTAGVPTVASTTQKLSLTVGWEHVWQETTSKEKMLRWEMEKEMTGPDDQFELIATYRSGKMDLAYEGTYNVVTEDGRTCSFPTSGTLKHVIVSETEIGVRRFEGGTPIESRSLEEDDSLEEAAEPQYEENPEAGEDDIGEEVYDEQNPGDGDEEFVANEEDADPQDEETGFDQEREVEPQYEENLETGEEVYGEQNPGDGDEEFAANEEDAEPQDEEPGFDQEREVEPQYGEDREAEEDVAAAYGTADDQLTGEITYEDQYENQEASQDTADVQEEEEAESEDVVEPDNQGDEETYSDTACIEEEVAEPSYQEEAEFDAAVDDGEAQENEYEASKTENGGEPSWE